MKELSTGIVISATLILMSYLLIGNGSLFLYVACGGYVMHEVLGFYKAREQ